MSLRRYRLRYATTIGEQPIDVLAESAADAVFLGDRRIGLAIRQIRPDAQWWQLSSVKPVVRLSELSGEAA